MHFRKSTALSALASALISPSLMAQELPQEEELAAAGLAAENDDGSLAVIVVVAQKREQRLSEVPVAVDVVQGEELSRLNLGTFEEMSRYVPTFNVAEGASGNRITLRGISSGTNRGFEQSVGMFVDNIYAGRAAQFSAPFFDLERIEVLKGPQSILFGKNTVAGAVSVVTAKPKQDAEYIASAGYETRFGGWDISGVINQPLSDNMQTRLAYKHTERANGVLENSFTGKEEPSIKTDVARASLAWQPGLATINAKYEYSKQSRVGGLFQIIEEGGRGALFRAVDPQFESELNLKKSDGAPGTATNAITSHNASLRIMVPMGDGTLVADSGYSTYKLSAFREDSDFSPLNLITYSNDENFTQYSQELRAASDANARLAYTAGLFFQSQHYVSRPFFEITAASLRLFNINSQRNFDQRSETYSAFGELSYELAEGLRLIGGGRYVLEDKHVTRSNLLINPASGQPETNATILGLTRRIFANANYNLRQRLSEEQFTPAVTLQYKPDRALMAYAKYSRGFKSGGFDASDAIGNAVPYKSEKVSAYEAGVKWSPTRKLSLNVTGFYSRYKDLQSQAFNGVSFITTNAARASTRGLEIESRWRPLGPLTLAGSLAYLDSHYDSYPGATCTTAQAAAYTGTGRCTQDLSGRPLLDSPKWNASLNANYEQELGGEWLLNFNLGTNIRSSAFVATDLDPLGHQGGYATIDASLDIIAPNDWLTVSVLGKNLTDERAKTYLVNNPFLSGTKSATIIAPRTLEIRATLRY